MRKILLTLTLLLLFTISVNATITGTDRGSGGTEVDQATLAISPSGNFTANSFAVLAIAYTNDGGGGSDSYSSIADNHSPTPNTWTSRQALNYDPGAANAGVVIRIFTAPIVGLTTGESITITWGAALTAKAWVLMEFTTNISGTIQYSTGGTDTGEANQNPTLTTGSITSGNAVIATFGVEWSDIWTMDSDTSNGTWSQTAANHAGSSGTAADTSTAVVAQRKITTGTGTQTYNPTLSSSRDVVGAWIEITEVAAPTINPSSFFLVMPELCK